MRIPLLEQFPQSNQLSLRIPDPVEVDACAEDFCICKPQEIVCLLSQIPGSVQVIGRTRHKINFKGGFSYDSLPGNRQSQEKNGTEEKIGACIPPECPSDQQTVNDIMYFELPAAERCVNIEGKTGNGTQAF
jgi:hypothetical protein